MSLNWKLPGLKTYLLGSAMILVGLLSDPMDEKMIAQGLGFVTLRAGVAKVGT